MSGGIHKTTHREPVGTAVVDLRIDIGPILGRIEEEVVGVIVIRRVRRRRPVVTAATPIAELKSIACAVTSIWHL